MGQINPSEPSSLNVQKYSEMSQRLEDKKNLGSIDKIFHRIARIFKKITCFLTTDTTKSQKSLNERRVEEIQKDFQQIKEQIKNDLKSTDMLIQLQAHLSVLKAMKLFLDKLKSKNEGDLRKLSKLENVNKTLREIENQIKFIESTRKTLIERELNTQSKLKNFEKANDLQPIDALKQFDKKEETKLPISEPNKLTDVNKKTGSTKLLSEKELFNALKELNEQRMEKAIRKVYALVELLAIQKVNWTMCEELQLHGFGNDILRLEKAIAELTLGVSNPFENVMIEFEVLNKGLRFVVEREEWKAENLPPLLKSENILKMLEEAEDSVKSLTQEFVNDLIQVYNKVSSDTKFINTLGQYLGAWSKDNTVLAEIMTQLKSEQFVSFEEMNKAWELIRKGCQDMADPEIQELIKKTTQDELRYHKSFTYSHLLKEKS